MQAYLDDATIHMYGNSSVTEPLDDLVTDMLTRDEFPFTGFQMMIAGIVAVVLVGGGIALAAFFAASEVLIPSSRGVGGRA